MAKNKLSAGSSNYLNKTALSENYFSRIFEYGFDAIVVTDNSNNIKAWNKVAEKMFGYSFDAGGFPPLKSGLNFSGASPDRSFPGWFAVPSARATTCRKPGPPTVRGLLARPDT